ncbi:hypothetical protein FA10DRAFT_277354 [Acaromyces ingoldii]|uniref:DUF6534 domain-containing protein n=1 Tax=Acaromyces ingoldii TaxID=215250 RepID=A0A316YWK9_9BASI|nr:hypothetical protein FA10DRAFT_277354 [Acaromyces ingoldii]PWN93571.1 hypothetical protein FA10DRAFT_277354 [Acaromyces ingoldii]
MRPRLPARRPRAVSTFFVALLVLICFTFATFTAVAAQSLTTDVDLRARADTISKSQPHLVHLLPRQATTQGKDTNADSDANGGAKSAETAASAAGASINTGAGGDRSTPASRKQFAELLSGLFFGTLFTLILGGAFIVQAWHYFERFGSRGSDRLILQILVAVLMFFSIFQMCILIHRIYDLHVAHFGNFAFPLLTIGWEVAGSFVCIGFMSGSVQLYFAHRVWLSFKKSKIILIPAIILISWTFCGGVASAALVIRAGSTANVKGQALHAFLPNSAPWQFSVIFATWLCSNAAIDVWLCVALLMQLSKMQTPFYHTRHAVARLLLLSLETCFATTACSFVSMILFLSVPYQFYYYIPFMPIGQIYGSSLVVTLMLRPSIARELAQDQVRDKVTEAPSLGATGLGPSNGASEETVVTHVLGPSSLVTPVLRRLMRREERKRPRTDVALTARTATKKAPMESSLEQIDPRQTSR